MSPRTRPAPPSHSRTAVNSLTQPGLAGVSGTCPYTPRPDNAVPSRRRPPVDSTAILVAGRPAAVLIDAKDGLEAPRPTTGAVSRGIVDLSRFQSAFSRRQRHLFESGKAEGRELSPQKTHRRPEPPSPDIARDFQLVPSHCSGCLRGREPVPGSTTPQAGGLRV